MNSDFSNLDRIKQMIRIAAAFLWVVLLFSSGQVVAQEAGASTGSSRADVLLDEITVTARRREERLLDQPMSIAAITADQMQVLGI